MSDVEYNNKALKSLIAAFKKIPKARVGVLSSKDNRNVHIYNEKKEKYTKTRKLESSTNAIIGAKHEFGEDGMPMRSFLRVPISDNLQNYLENSGAFDEEVLKRVIKEGSLRRWVAKIGILAEKIVQDGFDSGGFGKWKPSKMKYKKNKQTLVETTQLRRSIASEVESD